MIRLIYYEFIKLVKRKSFLSLILCMLLMDGILLFFIKNIEDPGANLSMYRTEIHEVIKNKKIEDAITYLEEERLFYEKADAYKMALEYGEDTTNVDISEAQIARYIKNKENISYMYARKTVVEEIYSYYKSIYTYSDYVKSIENNVEKLIHSPMWLMMSDKEKEDIYVHAYSYEKLKKLQIEPISYWSVETYSNSMVVRLIAFIVVCTISIFVLKEDEEEMSQLLMSTPKGHRQSAIAKIICFLIVSFVFVVLLQLFDCGMHVLLYGGIELNAPIQAIPSLFESPLKINVGIWLIASMFIFAFGLSMFSILFLFLYHIFENKIKAVLLFFTFFVVEAIFYTVIAKNSFFVPLSHVNVLRLFEGDMLGTFLSYQHLFFIRIPSYLSVLLLCISIGILFSIVYIIFYKRKLGEKARVIPSYTIRSSSLFLQEANRILQLNKGIVVLLVLLLALPFVYVDKWKEDQSIYGREKEIHAIYEEYEGPISADVKEKLAEKIAYFDAQEETYLLAKKAYINEEMSYQQFMDITEKYEENIENAVYYRELYDFILQDKNYIIYNKGLNALFGILNPHKDISRIAFMLILVFLFISSISYQKEEEKLYITTHKGIDIRRKSLLTSVFIGVGLIFVCMEVVDFVYVTKLFPISSYKVPLRLLYELNNLVVPTHLAAHSAFTYLLSACACKIFALMSVCCVSIWIFRFSKNRIVGLLISAAVFFIPMFLYYNGFTFMIHFSIFDVCMGNLFLMQTFSMIRVLIILIIDILCGYFIIKSFKGA